jgi:8-oxo-dGTP pyrophosphatase MutT (NUDIX family)
VSRNHASPRPASTVVLVRRDGDGLEVFLVRRHDNIAFMGGAHVFPGGRVDAADNVADPQACCDGVAEAVARMRGRSAGEAIAFHVAAVRELFEEAGVLLARDSQGVMVSIEAAMEAQFMAYRRELAHGRLTLRALVERERLRIALDALALFAHWVTPEVETRRFDTHFFLAVAPDLQQAAHDDHETTEGSWIRPGEAIDRCLRGDIALPPPTWTTLRALSRVSTVAEAWTWAQAEPVPRVQPCFTERADGTRVVMLPGDPGCPAVEGFDAEEKRFLLENGRWKPIEP